MSETNSIPIYCVFEHFPDKSRKFIGYFTAEQAQSYAEQVDLRILYNGTQKWNHPKSMHTMDFCLSIGWMLQAQEMSEAQYECLPVLRDILSNEPEFNIVEYASRPVIYNYASIGLNDHGIDKVHRIVTVLDKIVIRITTSEPECTKGIMYLPIGRDMLKLPYIHNHKVNNPKEDERKVKSGEWAICFDTSNISHISKLNQIVKYANIMCCTGIKGLWIEINGSSYD